MTANEDVGLLRRLGADGGCPTLEELEGGCHQVVQRSDDLASLEVVESLRRLIAWAIQDGVAFGAVGPGGDQPLEADSRPGQGRHQRSQLGHLAQVVGPGKRPLHQQVAGVGPGCADRVDVVLVGPGRAPKVGGGIQFGGDGVFLLSLALFGFGR
jgi:hypothetical protein